jgi:hypothetical protein
VELLAGLLGAVVGGILAIAGSVVVGRREVTRRHRITLHLSLLPQLPNQLRAPNAFDLGRPTPTQRAEKIEREATVASRTDRDKARTILARTKAAQSAFNKWRSVRVFNRADGTYAPTPEGDAFEKALDEAVQAAQDYRQWLASHVTMVL